MNYMRSPDASKDGAQQHLISDMEDEQADDLPGAGGAHSVVARIRARQNEYLEQNRQLLERLLRLGLAPHHIASAIRSQTTTGASLVHELISLGFLQEEDYFRAVAEDLGLAWADCPDSSRILMEVSPRHPRLGERTQVCCRGDDGNMVLYVAPDGPAEVRYRRIFTRKPEARLHYRICSPRAIRAAIEIRQSARDLHAATGRLNAEMPHLSAKSILVPWQAFCLGVFLIAFPLGLVVATKATLLAFHLVATGLFLAAVLIRLAAWFWLLRTPVNPPGQKFTGEYPFYSVLVALHDEAAVVPQLVRAMSRLDWPASRLEILYVCEADDARTLAAFETLRLPNSHRIVLVPPGEPRTKPKALNVALLQATGELLVIYDAEDRPHPGQLREAAASFGVAGPELACLQAPLQISNAPQNWLSKMFAFEYAAHFRGLLPFLASISVPLPLGGTSNHFRRAALDAVLGWDPYNVTEDADLGIRLYRFGYRCGVLTLPTLEDAPSRLAQWLPQRTRWIKGWMQTAFVHNRDIRALEKAVGRKSLWLFEILMIGFILSPLLYLISLIEVFGIYYLDLFDFAFGSTLIEIDMLILAMGHVAYLALASTVWRKVKGVSLIWITCSLPFYWMLGSVAAWRAVFKLVTMPHQWEKTAHQPASAVRQS